MKSKVTIIEKTWHIVVDLSGVLAPEELAERLKNHCGTYTYRVYDNATGTSSDEQVCLGSIKDRCVVTLPKGTLPKVQEVLRAMDVTYISHALPEYDPMAIAAKFVNPARSTDPTAEPEYCRPERLQLETLTTILSAGRNGAVEYGMGGGKTILIAKLSTSWRQLRPLVVTSAASGDSQQLAAKLAVITGEKVYLAGCASGKLTKEDKKRLFVRKPEEATIIVGSHNMYDKVTDPSDKVGRIILGARMVLIDEAHECATLHRMERLTRTNPEVAIALTATWRKNWSKTDLILSDFLSTDHRTLATVTHQEVQETGRVTPMEIHAWQFDRREWPNPDWHNSKFEGFLDIQKHIDYHTGRNLYLAYLCDHLIRTNEKEGRGCILAFGQSIKHIERVVKMLVKIRGKTKSEAEAQNELYTYNSQLPEEEKTRKMRAMAAGEVKIVFATETLSRGIDMNTIYDIVDLGGLMKIVQLIQKSGRAVRPDGDAKLARVHILRETTPDEPHENIYGMLRGCSRNKIVKLEEHFGVKHTYHASETQVFGMNRTGLPLKDFGQSQTVQTDWLSRK